MDYQIPKSFLPGFEAISRLNHEEVILLAEALEQLPVGFGFQEFKAEIREKEGISETALIAANSIFSFGGLLLKNKDPLEQLAEDLSDAFQQEQKDDFKPEQIEQLKQNLIILFNKAENIEKTFKAYQLLSENAHNYQDSRVITDVRMIFDEDIQTTNQTGLIIHQLKLEYLENNQVKSFFISLDNDDLLKLKEELNRATEKEDSIGKNNPNINFIKLR